MSSVFSSLRRETLEKSWSIVEGHLVAADEESPSYNIPGATNDGYHFVYLCHSGLLGEGTIANS